MRVRFASSEGFYRQLKERVDAYFRRTGFSRHDNPRMYAKAAILLTWLVTTYVLLMFVASTWWQAVPLAILLGFAVAGIGFNLGHDGAHGSISGSSFVNGVLARTFDLMGASSYIWHFKHNVLHHSYPNIIGADEDIDAGPMARLSPHQPHYWIHRFQFIYLWILYGFLLIKWQFYDDYRCVACARIAAQPIPRPKGWQLVSFVLGKGAFLTWTLALPLMLHSVWDVVLLYLLTSFTIGLTLSVVFQLAHATESAAFPEVTAERPRCEQEWAVHQVLTTVDFARSNRLLNWYLGGLNFQVEHHLFPHIAHIHYPALARIVEAVCAEYDLRYVAHPTFAQALAAHHRWLLRMGRPGPWTGTAEWTGVAGMGKTEELSQVGAP